jgi:transposase
VADAEHRLGAVNTARFIDWIEHWLVPRLRRGDVVVLDNLVVHKAATRSTR